MNATGLNNRMQHALAFGAHDVKTISRGGLVWMSGNEIGRALEYADPDTAVKKIYSRNADEFSPSMTKIFQVVTAGGKQAIRFFSLRGAHLLAMFARTEKAKAFRIWVLDMLDREVADLKAASRAGERLDEDTKHNIQAICSHMEFLRSWWARFGPGVRGINGNAAAGAHDHFVDGVCFSRSLVRTLGLNSLQVYAADFPWNGNAAARDSYRFQTRGAA